MEDTVPIEGGKALDEIVEEETGIHPVVSEQMELEIGHILEKINRFTQLVTMLNYLSHEIEHVIIPNNPINMSSLRSYHVYGYSIFFLGLVTTSGKLYLVVLLLIDNHAGIRVT